MLCKITFLFWVQLILPIFASEESEGLHPKPIVVSIAEGRLRGQRNVSRDGRIYYEFLGIRYAKLSRRFQIASSPKSWEGVKNATKFAPQCLQYYYDPTTGEETFEGEEDCLFLNVYTPKLPNKGDKRLFPVMIFFHEGGFLYGSGKNYGPKYVMDEDVVIVTINYRLSAMGFLSTEDEEAPGNMGLKDQVKSLEWVQRNIASFNGDPNKVTIFGYSAGGASVTYHLLSKMSKGLFHRAIAQSGSALNPWAFAPTPLKNTKILAQSLGCLSNNTKEIVSCLQKKDAKEIARLQRAPFVEWFVDPLYVFVPSVEKVIGDGTSNFLLKTPREIIDSKAIPNNVPLMTGCVKEDGLLLHGAYISVNKTLSESMDLNWDSVAPVTFFYEDLQKLNSTEGKRVSQEIRNFYFAPNDTIGWGTKEKLSHAYTDRWFLKGVKDFSVSYTQNRNTTVFNYITTYNKFQTLQESLNTTEILDTSHGEDLLLFFVEDGYPEITQKSEMYNISKIYIKLWVNFATSGNPNGHKETGTNWTPVDTNESRLKWFHINDVFQMTAADFTDRPDFWTHLPVSQ